MACSRAQSIRFKDASRRPRRLPSAILEPNGPPALSWYMAGTGKQPFQPNRETWMERAASGPLTDNECPGGEMRRGGESGISSRGRFPNE
jgi:hypothetical protein